MSYSIEHIAEIVQAQALIVQHQQIEHLLMDSRKLVFPASSLFIALASNRNNGAAYIDDLYKRGVRSFLVHQDFDAAAYPQGNFLRVPNTLKALQQLAAYHRQQFHIPVIGITGSNGKTIVKEWLYQLLSAEYHIVRSPRSYNSQIGVPLSVWQMQAQHSLAIFEAGISTLGEMQQLQAIIQPTIGVLTSLGDAHSEGFASQAQKLQEKLQLFTHAEAVIFNQANVQALSVPVAFSWGQASTATLQVLHMQQQAYATVLHLKHQQTVFTIDVPFTDIAYIENALTCISVMLYLQYSIAQIQQRIAQLQPVDMRLQLKKGLNGCTIINDSYSNDIASLTIALDYLQQQSGAAKKTVILSDLLQHNDDPNALYTHIAQELQERKIDRLIGIGEQMQKHQTVLQAAVPQAVFFDTVNAFLAQYSSVHFKDEMVLLKGARKFAFERIVHWLEQKVHQTVMEINLTAMVHNLKQYQQCIAPSTKVMAMVKAFSYGSGSAEVARLLQFHQVDYLAVAYADEGVELRKAGIALPIMVMNVDAAAFDALVEYNLEPEIYSFGILQALQDYLEQQAVQAFPVHIKLNTGMNRLGFDASDIPQLCTQLQQQTTMAVVSVFSHLVSSEVHADDSFTQQQFQQFQQASLALEKALGYSFLQHIANTAAILRHPALQLNMVRLGIGLYGVDSAATQQMNLQTVATLKSTIAQIRTVKAVDTVGYNRKGVVQKDSKIATIRIGYADGYSRRLGNGIGHVWLHHQLAPTIGHICMDMLMVDVTAIPEAKEGDVVEIFGPNLPVQQVAAWQGTIAYEVFTSISQRVKRVYLQE